MSRFSLKGKAEGEAVNGLGMVKATAVATGKRFTWHDGFDSVGVGVRMVRMCFMSRRG